VTTEQSVKQDYTDALFQIGENMEDMQRFTDELPEFIEAGKQNQKDEQTGSLIS